MQRFKLICDNSCDLDTHIVTHDFTAEQLSEVLMNLDMFLKGVGYVYDGQLVIEEDIQLPSKDGVQHNDHFYDINRNR